MVSVLLTLGASKYSTFRCSKGAHWHCQVSSNIFSGPCLDPSHCYLLCMEKVIWRSHQWRALKLCAKCRSTWSARKNNNLHGCWQKHKETPIQKCALADKNLSKKKISMNYIHLVPLAQGIVHLKLYQIEAMSLSASMLSHMQKWSNRALKSVQLCLPFSCGKGSKENW